MKTWNHYSPELKSKESKNSIPNLEIISQVIQHLPYYALILDSDRRILYTNDQLLSDHSNLDVSSIFGKRPGDIFQCENAQHAGCGNSEFCKYCGIFKTLTECQSKNMVIVHACNLTIQINSEIATYEFLARCSPLILNNEKYLFLTLTDTSQENKKLILERIFYHDVVNLLGSVQGLSEILNSLNKQENLSEYLICLSNVSEQLRDIILTQRDLGEAENRTLKVHLKKVKSLDILTTVVDSSRYYKGFRDVRIILSDNPMNFHLETDPVLLNRVLINMLKNAIEACASEISVGCYCDNEKASFFIHNNTYILPEHQPFIFKRNFSTKDENRGLGTYSMRLLGENYLKGKVCFDTDIENGTTFLIDIPLNLKL